MKTNPTFVHLTDLHIGNPDVPDDHIFSDTSATLATILEHVKSLRPEPKFIVASGDLTNRGDEGSYRELLKIFEEAEIDIPVIFALGNHDTRAGFYRAVLERDKDLAEPYFHDRVIDGIHIITLDSSAPNEVGGSLEPEQLAWLRERLDANPDLPKLIVVHHAPSLDEDDYEGEWEAISCTDTIKLREVLAGRDNILGILSGHMHYDRVAHWNGIPVVVGIGQHAATDVLVLHDRLRMVEGASFAIGTVRPSGLTVSFVPQPSARRELHTISYERLRQYLKPAVQAAE